MPTLQQALQERRSQRTFSQDHVPAEVLHRLLWAAQGITTEDGKRTAPSAHGLHPLQLYVVAGRIEDNAPGVYRYHAQANRLEAKIDGDARKDLEQAAIGEQPWVGAASGIISICADCIAPTNAFADQPPYGTRGLRYVHIEAGAVAQNIALQAAEEGLGCVLVAGFNDDETAKILGLDPPLAPVLHMCFGWPAKNV